MMCPPHARVRYEEMPKVSSKARIFDFSLVRNWLLGPVLMFALFVKFLRDHPEFMRVPLSVWVKRKYLKEPQNV